MNRTGCVEALLHYWHRLTSQGSLTDDGSMLRSVGVRAKASNDHRMPSLPIGPSHVLFASLIRNDTLLSYFIYQLTTFG